MKKHILFFILAMLPMAAYADDSGSCGDNLTWTFVESTGTLTISGSGAMTDFANNRAIPWYAYINSIEKVIIENGVTTIGRCAFYLCNNISSVTIPNSVIKISDYSFILCSNIGSIVIPNSVTSIGENAFCGCSGLTTITIPSSVTFLGAYAFAACDGLSSVNILGSNLTSLNDWVFGQCGNLASVTIPNSVTQIGEYAFSECSSLTSIIIPNSVTSIGENAFYGCALSSINIPQSVTSIAEGAFSSCSSLTSIMVASGNSKYDSRNNCNAIIETSTNTLLRGCSNTLIPNGVTKIGNHAFSDCVGLTSINIPNSVTSIGSWAFDGCNSLATIDIPDNTTFMGSTAFRGCSELTSISIPNNVPFIGQSTFQDCTNLISATIGNSVTSIDEEAFKGCSNLTSIDIPNSVTYLGERVFEDCTNMISASIGNGLTSISNYSFYNCSSLASVTIPNSVTKIGSSAFEGCSGLTSVTIPNSVTTIENGAFCKCTGLTSLTIPSSVTSIGNYAFSGCNIKSLETHYKTLNNDLISMSSLEDLVVGAEVTTISNYGDLYLTSIIVESGNPNYDSRNNCNALIETGTNTLLKGCRNSIIPDGVIIIGEGAFFECKGLTSINIPNSVTTINRIAFQNCKDVTSIAIGKNVSSIYWGAFAGSSKLTSITVSSENQNYNSKNNCNAIIQTSSNTLIAGCKNTIIPDNVTVIAPCAFMQSGFTSITIPNSVVEIWDMAFAGCSALTSMIIPGNVTKIGYQAFAGCTALESMKVMATTPPVADEYYNDQHHEAFDNYDIPLYVPEASLEDYKKTSPWNKFSSIIAYDKKYQLIYKVDDEVYKTYNFEEGSVITPEPAPTKEGHTFSGWSEIPETMPAHDFVVTGSFTKESYKLIYVVDGAVYKTVSYEFGATITPEAAPTKEGYTFSGWSDIPETMPAKDVTVSGTFAINKYTLTFIVGGNIYENRTLEYGSTIIVPEMPELTGYTFTWGEVPATMPAQNVTIVGEYQPNLYNVTYLINGQFFAIFKVAYGSTITPPEAPERAGSTFTWGDYPETMPAHDITIEGTYTVGINLVQDNQGNQHIEIYTVGGKKVNKIQRGVNIIRRGSKAVKVAR